MTHLEASPHAHATPRSAARERDLSRSPGPLFRELRHTLAAFDRPLSLSEIRGLMADKDWCAENVGAAVQTDSASYVRTLIYRSEHVELLVMTWLPGQQSPIHDHAGSLCLVHVLRGVGEERRFRSCRDGFVEADGEASLIQAGATTVSFDNDIHTFGNAASADASPDAILVTVHIYSPPLAAMTPYVNRG